MTTPTRRQFITALTGLAVAPFALSRAVAAKPPCPPDLKSFDLHYPPGQAGELVRILPVSRHRAIKVPSNRYWVENMDSICREGYHPGYNAYHAYFREWDGTFKLEVCDNPAYVLADLMGRERNGQLGLLIALPREEWQALYHYGQHCDELVTDNPAWIGNKPARIGHWEPRYTVASLTRANEPFHLYHHLRMHFLSWKSTDPRYRTSWPGIPYPGDSA